VLQLISGFACRKSGTTIGRPAPDARIIPMGDPLSIPDDKRAGSGRVSLFDTPERPWFVVFVVIALILNGWFDYYHHFGFLLDIFFIIVWVVKSSVRIPSV